MGVNRLTGVPWHTEKQVREDGDKRRYKGKCKHYRYDENHCSLYNERCRGSAHCQYYDERKEENRQSPFDDFKAPKVSDITGKQLYPDGSRVTHNICGSGKIENVSDGKITVLFDNGDRKVFSLEVCVEKKLLVKE